MALDYLPTPSWSVVYGETPSASKWSELGANDDALATGAGIDDLAILTRHIANGGAGAGVTGAKLGTPVAYGATSSQSIPNASPTTITSVTELFDHGGNASGGVFTAPYDGIYIVTGHARYTNTNGRAILWFNINGSAVYRFESHSNNATADAGVSGFMMLSLSAGDTVKFDTFQETGASAAPAEFYEGVALVGRLD